MQILKGSESILFELLSHPILSFRLALTVCFQSLVPCPLCHPTLYCDYFWRHSRVLCVKLQLALRQDPAVVSTYLFFYRPFVGFTVSSFNIVPLNLYLGSSPGQGKSPTMPLSSWRSALMKENLLNKILRVQVGESILHHREKKRTDSWLFHWGKLKWSVG